jgi:hypothetical protein
MPGHDGVRCNDRRNAAENPAAEWLALGRQTAALVIRESQGVPATYEPLVQDPILLDQIAHGLSLLPRHPAAECGQEELELDRFYHFRRLSGPRRGRVTCTAAGHSSFRILRDRNRLDYGNKIIR